MRIQFRIIGDDNSVISEDEILHFDKDDDRLEAMSFANSKAILVGIQERMVSAQAASFLERHRCCDLCGSLLLSKGRCRIQFRTAFGTIALVSPRFHRCLCQPSVTKSFSPLTALFTEHTAPELLYLETRWASLDDRQASNAGQGAVLAVGATGSGAVGGDDARQTLQGHVGA